jgi:N-acetylneuraminate synthase/sialic acid synthase
MTKGPVIKVGKYVISENSPCFVITELGHNHQGNLDTAKKMIDAAAESGAQAVKLQKRFNKELYTEEMYCASYDHENSFGETYGEHREFLEFGKKEYLALKKHAEKRGLVFFATAFDFSSVDFLDEIGVPAYKIASALITDTPLVEYIAKKRKPIFLSTGTATTEDVDRAYKLIRKYKTPLCLLQCTAAYPLFDYREADLGVIRTFKERYPGAIIGYSGHESGIVLPVVAYLLGARVVEKHFTLNRAMKGSDHHYSLEPQGLKKMIRDLQRVHESLGSEMKRVHPSEFDAKKKMGKSIVARKKIRKGTVIVPELLTFKSPGTGIPPFRVEQVMGRVALEDIGKDALIDFHHLSKNPVKGFKIKKPIDWSRLR